MSEYAFEQLIWNTNTAWLVVLLLLVAGFLIYAWARAHRS